MSFTAGIVYEVDALSVNSDEFEIMVVSPFGSPRVLAVLSAAVPLPFRAWNESLIAGWAVNGNRG